jgi:internalin A
MRLTIGDYNKIIDDNLEILDLDDNQIINLTPLSQFTKLTTLDLNDNQISGISPLSQLTNTKIKISALSFIYHQNPTHPLILSTPLKEFDKDLTDQLFEDLNVKLPYRINNITSY